MTTWTTHKEAALLRLFIQDRSTGETSYCAKHEALCRTAFAPRPRVKERKRQSPRIAAGFR